MGSPTHGMEEEEEHATISASHSHCYKLNKQEGTVESLVPAHPLVYAFTTGICTTDGTGDYVHGERFLSLLSQVSKERKFSRAAMCNDKYSCNPYPHCPLTLDPSQSNVDLEILISYKTTNLQPLTQLYIGEYGNHLDLLRQQKSVIFAPLGLSFSLGYMKPLLPIDLAESKSSLFQKLDQQWQSLIWPHGYMPKSLFAVGYYSPNKSFSSEALRAFTHSPLTFEKEIIFFVKGEMENINALKEALKGSNSKIITTKERVLDKDWHILLQLADVMIATGDSSCSDPFFYRSLCFWNAHKPIEAKAWEITATEWEAPKEVSKNRVIEYIKLLQDQEKLPQFMKMIDQKFMDDWKQFCTYIETRYTLTPAKIEMLLNMATQMHLAAQFPECMPVENVKSSLEKAKEVLDLETVRCLAMNYHFKHQVIFQDIATECGRFRHLLGVE